ncbi:hypothetical protein ACP4OV_010287 [Aristida adscensionis]
MPRRLKIILGRLLNIPTFILFMTFILLVGHLTVIPYHNVNNVKCSNSELDRWSNGTFEASLDTLSSYLIFTELGLSAGVSRSHLAGMPNAQGLLYIPRRVHLRNVTNLPLLGDAVLEPALSVSFTMGTVHQFSSRNHKKDDDGRTAATTSPGFLILPDWAVNMGNQELFGAGGLLAPTNSTLRKDLVANSGGDVFVEVRTLGDGHIMVVNVIIIKPAAARYTVWIEYYPYRHLMLVYVAREGNPKPKEAIAVIQKVRLNHEDYSDAYFGFFGSVGQLLLLRTWNSTAHWQCPALDWDDLSKYRDAWWTIIVLSVVSIIITIRLWYLENKHDRWEDRFNEVARTIQHLEGTPMMVSFTCIRRATDNFHESKRLGAGGYGEVYRCTLPAAYSRTEQAMEVAVKKFTQRAAANPQRSRQAEDRRLQSFVDEVKIINLLRHRNIVPLIGWCYGEGLPLLIYEYMAEGSLDQHLFPSGATATLQWDTRYGIVRDIATALRYIHHEHTPTVLHRDMKASNIMLDANFCARLGDFGIASTVAAERSSVSGLGGTRGYLAPEGVQRNRNSRETDVYAFGVLVLEIVTGKKWDFQMHQADHITDWVWLLHGEGRLIEAADVVITTGGHQVLEAERLLLLALACNHPNPLKRPSMANVVDVINMGAPLPVVPLARPPFEWPPEGWRSLHSDYSTAESDFAASLVELMPFSEELLGFSGEHASVSVYHTPTIGSPEHNV